ncbi:MAG TPA: phosphoribosylformylglycinamidine cyclo-ligase [Crenotrichaceae bacterium]|nr:phosphoribosylformylglycinamidine cyclo-ligase [Crenotrichaceae bacterium]
MLEKPGDTMDYRSAGVDIEAGNTLVDRIKPIVRKTHIPGVLGGIGGFGGLFELPHGYSNPVLVSGTDGVGTKLKLALEIGKHDTVGIDLVGMCVNDILVCGAKPLYFLDYYASGKLDVGIASEVIKGIADGCVQSGMALIGGETAEMPGMYHNGEYDLAGFCVGIVEKNRILDGSTVEPGDLLIGIPSSGLHSNGYSLVRKIIAEKHIDLTQLLAGSPLSDLLLEPTRIYVNPITQILASIQIKALSHITGGGITENLPRVLPKGVSAEINLESITFSPLFTWLQNAGNIQQDEMLRTFNCGIGMIVCVGSEYQHRCMEILERCGYQAKLLGQLVKTDAEPKVNYV